MRHTLLALAMLFLANNAFCAEQSPSARAAGAVTFPIAMYEDVDMFRKYYPVDDNFFIRLTYVETFSPISKASIVKIEAGACCGAPETRDSSGCLRTIFEGKVGMLDRLEADKRHGQIILHTLEFDKGTNDFTTPTRRQFPFTFTCS
ncbi:MAG: hypothetical protein B193_1938 [Solidesulfovibrio magneticus str. Maddingley MBC34]|uniref:Uncharacterized protein n=1 Tax=Solidesulfovibrio magneticus str. Maddingley MBC34 TaxID=1206767 RepID=K6GE33_9BACT|nr:MAG: hypothetical protein B193_1938 [Solidesulfovibrio magneticus str. Maddingley MBC34]